MTILSNKIAIKGNFTMNITIRLLFLLLLIFAESSNSFALQNKTTSADSKLEELINEALVNNPSIKTQIYKTEAMRKRIPQAGAWMDPKLNFNIMNFPVSEFGFNLEPMTQKQVSLMQQIPFPGLTRLKESVASYESEIANFGIDEVKNVIRKDVSLAYHEISYLDKAIEITEKNKRLLKTFYVIAAKKYEVGKGLQQDVLKAQVEISKITDKLISFNKKRDTYVAQLNANLYRPANSSIDELDAIEFRTISIDYDKLQETAAASSPLLKMVRKEIARNESDLKLSQKQYWPNFDVGIAYSQRDNRRDFFSAQFSINVPIWQNRKQDKRVEESALRIQAVERKYDDLINVINSRISSQLSLIQESNERLQLLKDVIIPQATQSLNSAISGYEVDKVDFLTLLNNQITLFNMEIDSYRILKTYNKDIAKLEYVIGQQIN